ncbi:MAG: hypothetical protein CK528_13260 [Alcaligenaceae bacterium]|nr:MAG: hypothetical protein CK528_13260 [Alcaligenaceae bacterium]
MVSKLFLTKLINGNFAVTRLAGDDVSSDRTDDLLVALTRAGKLSPTDMAKMAIEHHCMLRAHV